MIDSVLNLLFRCPHHRLTRPVSPVTKPGQPPARSYVVCLECGKQFEYHVKEMRIGKPIEPGTEGVVVPTDRDRPRRSTLKLALKAMAAGAIMLGALFSGRRKSKPRSP